MSYAQNLVYYYIRCIYIAYHIRTVSDDRE